MIKIFFLLKRRVKCRMTPAHPCGTSTSEEGFIIFDAGAGCPEVRAATDVI